MIGFNQNPVLRSGTVVPSSTRKLWHLGSSELSAFFRNGHGNGSLRRLDLTGAFSVLLKSTSLKVFYLQKKWINQISMFGLLTTGKGAQWSGKMTTLSHLPALSAAFPELLNLPPRCSRPQSRSPMVCCLYLQTFMQTAKEDRRLVWWLRKKKGTQ